MEKGCGVKGGIVHSDKNSDTNNVFDPKAYKCGYTDEDFPCDSTDGSCRTFNVLVLWQNIDSLSDFKTQVKIQVLNTPEFPLTIGSTTDNDDVDISLVDASPGNAPFLYLTIIFLKGYVAFTVANIQTVIGTPQSQWQDAIAAVPDQDQWPFTSANFYPELDSSTVNQGWTAIDFGFADTEFEDDGDDDDDDDDDD